MRSKAHIKSHPLHPMLVAFPIAFFIGTLLFDALSMMYSNESFAQTGRYLNIGGIISGLVAAVPGFIDYLYTVPPDSSAKARASKHALINVSMLVVFTVAVLLKANNPVISSLVLGLEVAGVALLSIAGWLGGTLVHRNQIGVDIRYAGSGKWIEEHITAEDGDRIKVATSAELGVNQMKLVHLNDKRIVIARTEEGYVAFEDRCTHKGGSLAGGSMMCGTVQCPWHGSQFDVKTGALKYGPARKRILTYKLEEENNRIYLML